MSDITTARIFTDGEKGITAQKLNDIIGQATIDPAFYTAKASSSTLDPTDTLLEVKAAGTYARITGQQVTDSVGANLNPQIWAIRLRSFNAIGNPAFEVDQRNVGATVAAPASPGGIVDSWYHQKSGTMVASAGQFSPTYPDIAVPGTSFRISRSCFRVTMTTTQASLAASDYLMIRQIIEGSRFRELSSDVHSISLLVRSSVAPLKFSVALRDLPTPTRSLTNLCTISTANTWTLISLPNLPVFPTAGTFNVTPGNTGYDIVIALAAGSTFTTTAGSWANGNFFGATGQDNFATNASATFDIGFVQHEPGSLCTTLQDKPFNVAYDEAQRYFCKTYDYGTALGAVAGGAIALSQFSTTALMGPYRYPKAMAKAPTVTVYNQATGVSGTFRGSNGTDYTASSINNPGNGGFLGINTSTMPAVSAGFSGWMHIVADTGW